MRMDLFKPQPENPVISPVERELRERLAQEIERRVNAERDASTDEMTGLESQKAFLKSKTDINESPNRQVVVIDLNNFKKVNDTLGHAAGDKALSDIAVQIKDVLPEGANAYRTGGDEFTVVTNKGDAEPLAKLIRDQVSTKAGDINVTAAAGYGDTTSEADAESYRQKQIMKGEAGAETNGQNFGEPVPATTLASSIFSLGEFAKEVAGKAVSLAKGVKENSLWLTGER